MITCVAAITASLALASATHAATAFLPLPVVKLSPADGSWFPQMTGSVGEDIPVGVALSWQVAPYGGLRPLDFLVTTSPPGPDGVLGYGQIATLFPGGIGYSGRIKAFFRQSPGTVYVQVTRPAWMEVLSMCDGSPFPAGKWTDECPGYRSPVYTWRVGGAPPPTTPTPTPLAPSAPTGTPSDRLSLASATTFARRFATKRWKVRSPRIKCRRTDQASFDCQVSWRRSGHRRTRLVQVYREAGRTSASVAS